MWENTYFVDQGLIGVSSRMNVTAGSALTPDGGAASRAPNSQREAVYFSPPSRESQTPVRVFSSQTPLPAAIGTDDPHGTWATPLPPARALGHARRQDPRAPSLGAGAKPPTGLGAPPLSPRSVTEFPYFWDTEGHRQRRDGGEAGGRSFTEHLPLSPAGLSPPPAWG